jgi:tRNA(Ile)-lysidine synthase
MCGIPQKNGKIIRPLLRFSASSIEKYIHEQGIEYCVDSSNMTDQFLRNKVRHQVIPHLEAIHPNVVETFSKNSRLFLQQKKFLDTHIQQYKNQFCKERKDRMTICIDALKNDQNCALILYELLHPFGFNADDVDNILNAADSISGKQFLSDTHILIKDRTHLIMEKKKANNDEVIIINTIEELENHGFRVEKVIYHSNFEAMKLPNIIYVDGNKMSFPLVIRNWEKGDSFYPFGMKTKKKLSDFFTDLKIDILEKQKIRLLCTQNKIVWIINYRADERFRVSKETEWYYKIFI